MSFLGLEMKESPWDLGRSMMVLSQGCSKMTENILQDLRQARACGTELQGRSVLRFPPPFAVPSVLRVTRGDFLVSRVTLATCPLSVISVMSMGARGSMSAAGENLPFSLLMTNW